MASELYDRISRAKQAGYSDDEIVNHLSSFDERVKTAIGAGYKPAEIVSYLSSQTTGAPKPEPQKQETAKSVGPTLLPQTPRSQSGNGFVENAIERPWNSLKQGYYRGAESGAHLLSNLAKAAGKITGTKPGGAFEDAENYYRQQADELEGKGASGVAGLLYQGAGRLPADVAKYTVAAQSLGGVGGMAAVDAAEAADRGAGAAATAGAKGALAGGLLKVSAPARMGTRIAGNAAAGASSAYAAGAKPEEVVASGLTMGAMAAPGGKGVTFAEANRPVQPVSIGKPAEAAHVPVAERTELPPPTPKQAGLPLEAENPEAIKVLDEYAQHMSERRESARGKQQPSLYDRLRSAKGRAQVAWVDQQTPMLDVARDLDTANAKARGPVEASKEATAEQRMNYMIDQSLGATTMAGRAVKDSGLLELYTGVGDTNFLEQLMIARHAQDVRGLGYETGRNGVMDDAMVRHGLNRIAIPAKGDSPAVTYGEVADRFTQFSNQILDMSTKSGLVSEETASYLKERYPNYVPLDRVFSAIEEGPLPHSVRGQNQVASLARQTIIQKLKGSSREIENPVESIFNKAQKAFGQVTRNNAAKYLRDVTQRVDPNLMREVPSGESVDSHRSISMLVDGVKRTYETSPELAAAAKSLSTAQMGTLERIAAVAVRTMKATTTGFNPAFAAANIFRDLGHTFVNGLRGADVRQVTTAIPEATKALFDGVGGIKSEALPALERQGGGFTSFDLSREQVMPSLELARAKKALGTEEGIKKAPAYLFTHPVRTVQGLFHAAGAALRGAEDALGRGESFGRVRLYESTKQEMLKQGYSPEDAEIIAVVESNNALPNYRRKGSVGGVLNSTVPYLNARIQGSRSLVRSLQSDPVGTAMKIGATVYMPVAMVTLWNMADEERRKAYFDIPEYIRRRNFIIVLNGKKKANGEYNVVKIPLAQGLDSLADPVRKGIESQYGGDAVGAMTVVDSLTSAFTPIEPVNKTNNPAVNYAIGGAAALTPQILKPTLQGMSNYDYFRQRPLESPKVQGLPAADRVQPYTSATAKTLARDVLPKVGINTSPIMTEEFIRGTIGGGTANILNATDKALMASGIAPKQEPGGKSVLDSVEGVFSGSRGGAYETEYWNLRKKAADLLTGQMIAEMKQNPEFQALSPEEQQKQLVSLAQKAQYRISKHEENSGLKGSDGPEKIAAMKQVIQVLSER